MNPWNVIGTLIGWIILLIMVIIFVIVVLGAIAGIWTRLKPKAKRTKDSRKDGLS